MRRRTEVGLPAARHLSLRDGLAKIYGDVLAVWQPWAELQVTGRGIDCGHHVAEEAPEDLAAALTAFLLPDCMMEKS